MERRADWSASCRASIFQEIGRTSHIVHGRVLNPPLRLPPWDGGGGRASLRVLRWGLACGGRLVGPRGGDFALGCSAGVGAGGFETRPYVCLFGTRRGAPGLLAGSTVGIGLWWAVGGTEEDDFALGCSAGAGAGGFETRPYVCLPGTGGGAGPPCGFHGGVWLVVGGWWDRGAATSPWAVLLVRAPAGLKPAPTSASSGRGVGRRALCGFHGGDWLVVGGWWDRGAATSPWAVLLVRARAGLKPAPTSASSGRGGGGRALCGFHGGDWLVVGGWWDRGATSPWAVLRVRAPAGLKPAPTSASSGRGVGGGPPCGFYGGDWLVVGGWWDRGATSPWAVLRVRARAGLKPAPTSASSGRGVGGGPPCGVHGGVWLVVGGWWDRGGRLRLGLFCGCGRGRV